MAYYWYPKSVSPSIKLQTGFSDMGGIKTVSIPLRNVSTDVLTNASTARTALENIFTALKTNSLFSYPIAHIIVSASWQVEDMD